MNPAKPSSPAALVKTVSAEGGGFQPLDSRTLRWLATADCERRFRGRRKETMGALVENELADLQAGMDREKDKAFHERMRDVNDRAVFDLKKLDRKGLLAKESFWR